ncbi:MAG TPA: glycosyltransferase [Candidatus Binatia bacterium]|nr:glycosyltransferase [Candidatus Binatia bacterium]
MALPRVSVVIPTWNRRRHLEEAIASVLAQTYTDYEIVVVDDGSTDDTRSWLEGRATDGRVVALHQENRGSSSARNAGLRAARGELIAFLDSDDLWLPRKLEYQIQLFDRNPAVGFVFCGSAKVDDHGATSGSRVPTPDFRGRAALAMIRRNMMPTPTVVVRKRLALEAGTMYEDLQFGEDWNYWIRIAARCETDFVPEVLVHFRDTPGSLSRLDFDSFRANTLGLFRGLYRDPESAALLAPYRKEALSQAHTRIAEEALQRGRIDVAREESWRAIRFRPGNRAAWRFLSRAILGKRLLGALRRLRG